MSVSVIIPAYRAASTIGRAIHSVLTQTRPAQEILVIDDGSPDGEDLASTVSVFPCVRVVRQDNGGAASARNRGIAEAKGTWVAFLDADDYWDATKLQHQLAVLQSHPRVGVLGSRWHEQEPNGARRVAPVLYPHYFGRLVESSGREAFELAMCMWTSSVMVRRTLLEERRFEPGLETAEDRDLWIRLAAAAPVYLVNQSLATYVQEPGSLSRSNVDLDCGNMLRVVRRHVTVLGRRELKAQEAIVYRRWASGHLARGQGYSAIMPAINRLRLQPLSLQAWWIAAKALAMAATGVESRRRERRLPP